jgi:serine protease Do
VTTTRATTAAVVATCALLVAGGCTGEGSQPQNQSHGQSQSGTQAPPPPADSASLPDIAERLAPSVVTVRTESGVGSGVVLRPEVVVTNQHVVGENKDVEIRYADGNTSAGTVLATDSVTDLAVVRTERKDLPVPEYRTQLPRPGETALAIGSPLGFENSVTAGIVSGLHREIPGSAARTQSLVDLIQTDASISPGNSGGALIDAQGRVIGINEAYIPPKAGAVSIGFAIPAATVVESADELLADGTASHPYLGVSLRPLTPAIRRQLDVQADSGVVVLGADENGPAMDAGVQGGDVITSVAGEDISAVEDILSALRGIEPGQEVDLTISRGGESQQLTVTVASREG